MRKAIIAGLVSASLIAGCTGDPPQDDPSATTVTVEDGGEVSTGSVTVRIRPGGVDQEGELSAATVDASSMPDQGALPKHLDVVGDPVEVSLSGASLTSPASVEFALDAGTKKQLGGSPPFVVWQDAKGDWRLLPAQLASSDTVVAKTDHFSFGFLASIDISAWGKDRAEDLRDYVTGRAGAEQPTCGDESTPREQGTTVSSDGGDGIKWCYGIESGSTVLKVTNNRRTFVTVQYPPSWSVKDGNSVSITLDTAARALGDWVGEFARGRDARVIDGGETLTLVVPDGGGGRVTAETDFLAWTLGALSFGVGVYSGVAQGVGLNAASGAQERLLSALAGDAPSDGYLSALQGCGKELVNAFGELDDLDVTDAAAQSAKLLWGCVPHLIQADIAATGVSMFGLGLILEAVSTAASLVLTGVHLIVTGSREIWDNLAALGGNSDPVYDIKVVPAGPPPLDDLVLSTAGLGPLLLGMNRDEAEATGLVEWDPDHCPKKLYGPGGGGRLQQAPDYGKATGNPLVPDFPAFIAQLYPEQESVITWIDILSPRIEIEGGIHVGDSLAQLNERFGQRLQMSRPPGRGSVSRLYYVSGPGYELHFDLLDPVAEYPTGGFDTDRAVIWRVGLVIPADNRPPTSLVGSDAGAGAC